MQASLWSYTYDTNDTHQLLKSATSHIATERHLNIWKVFRTKLLVVPPLSMYTNEAKQTFLKPLQRNINYQGNTMLQCSICFSTFSKQSTEKFSREWALNPISPGVQKASCIRSCTHSPHQSSPTISVVVTCTHPDFACLGIAAEEQAGRGRKKGDQATSIAQVHHPVTCNSRDVWISVVGGGGVGSIYVLWECPLGTVDTVVN